MVFTSLFQFKYAFYNAPALDNFIFKMSSRWTALLVVAFSIVVTIKLWFGDSFVCTGNSIFSSQYTNVNCYSVTYIKPATLITEKNSSAEIEPSVKKFRRYMFYYPWVNLLFLVHAFDFYLPHLCWQTYEGGYIRRLTAGVQKLFDKEESRCLELSYLAKYFLVTQGKHKLYTYIYLYFESCNCVIALAQTLWLIHFFNVTGVPDILPFQLDTWIDFKNFYFPQVGFCDLTTSNKFDSSLCLMPMNHLYMYMFLSLHMWYIILTIVTGFVVVYRVALLHASLRVFVAKSIAPLADRPVLKSLCYRISYSDWFFLTRLCRSMTGVDFAKMLDKIVILSQHQKDVDDDKSSLFEERMKEIDNVDESSIS